jgi:hypothetical protein
MEKQNIDGVGHGGHTRALMLGSAARYGQIEELRRVLSEGVCPNGVGLGQTAAFDAIEAGQHECLRILLEAGADVDVARNSAGYVAREFAAVMGRSSCVAVMEAFDLKKMARSSGFDKKSKRAAL